MNRPLKFALIAGVPLALALLVTATPAAAQASLDAASRSQKQRDSAQKAPQADVLPPALPGATSKADQAIPSDRPMKDLSPNDALFDAINRGDIADARDAINRGADLSARNVLGLTPIDLSVDLSRNDITFLMLSLRGASAGAVSAKAAAAGASAKAGTKPGTASAASAARPSKAALVAARTPAPPPVVPQKRQYAASSDPGTPAPQSGFLGFGARQQ